MRGCPYTSCSDNNVVTESDSEALQIYTCTDCVYVINYNK